MKDSQLVTLGRVGQDEINGKTYADVANVIMQEFSKVPANTRTGKGSFAGLTTTKLRGIYALVMNVYTQINERGDFAKHASDIQYLKVRMAYEAGRERSVRSFLEKTNLMGLVSQVTDYEKFLLYCRYAESLVAYFKFYGGKDK